MIVLDSNQLRQAAPPDGALRARPCKLGEANDHILAIPQMVLDEHLGYQGDAGGGAQPRICLSGDAVVAGAADCSLTRWRRCATVK